MERKFCAFTGHRPAKLPWRYDETAAECVRLKEVLTTQIMELARAGTTDFLSGMALGVDMYCAEIVLALREENPTLRLHCILPCREQEVKWNLSSQKRYHAILARANSTFFVRQDYSDTCMLERDRYLVEHACILLAVYNGTRRSGTGATVHYARRLGREIFSIDPLTCTVSHVKGDRKGRAP